MYEDRDSQARELADTVADQLKRTLQKKQRATLVVPGGSTPGPFLLALSQLSLPWERVDIMPSDERMVPEDSERSNSRQLRESLIQNRARNARLIPFHWDTARCPTALEALSETVRALLPIDVCVLGMGADMHVASLFPDGDRLKDALDPDTDEVLLPMHIQEITESRLTLTAPVLRNSRNLHLLVAGEEKEKALEAAQQCENWFEAPVRVLFDAPNPLFIHYAD